QLARDVLEGVAQLDEHRNDLAGRHRREVVEAGAADDLDVRRQALQLVEAGDQDGAARRVDVHRPGGDVGGREDVDAAGQVEAGEFRGDCQPGDVQLAGDAEGEAGQLAQQDAAVLVLPRGGLRLGDVHRRGRRQHDAFVVRDGRVLRQLDAEEAERGAGARAVQAG